MDGEINQQRSSYRHGLVLGLTMAEIMLLLVFCLLIAMATLLKSEQSKRVTAEQKLQEQTERDRELMAALHDNTSIAEKIKSLSGLTDPKDIDQYWRELVDSRTAVADLEKSGVSVKELRDRISDIDKLRANNIDIDKALRDAAVVAAIDRAMTKPGDPPATISAILDAIDRGMTDPLGPVGHQWPPIITLSEAGGYSFKTGSAELSTAFRDSLLNNISAVILANIKKYDVDVIEVVGHTDEQPLSFRQSNLDHDLTSVLDNTSNVATLVPADNAGLGLARAVSVVSVLRQSPLLAGYKLIPLSAAQLVKTDETLAIEGTPGDIPQRRRIEIRLRKSVPHEASASIGPASIMTTPPKPARPIPRSPMPLAPKPEPRPLFSQPNWLLGR
jgi:flagellar motor protein MotB